MSVLQPLYFSGGKYSAATDRKLLAALIGSEVSGTRLSGVIPAANGVNSMRVNRNSGLSITIHPGMCVIPDLTPQNTLSPGAYLCSIDSSNESLTMSTNSNSADRIDSIYAVVDETSFTVTNVEISSNIVTITTSTAHGFKAGQTVVISGVDDIFDGSYVIASITSTTKFTYAKTHPDITSKAVTATMTEAGTSYAITNKALASNVATLTTSSTTGLATGDVIIVKGVDTTFDGTYPVLTATSTTVTYKINKFVDDVSSTAVTTSSVANARVPFAIKIEESGGTTLDTKTKILLATVRVPGNNGTSLATDAVTDKRQFVSTVGGVHVYDSAVNPTGPTGPGRLRFDISTNTGPSAPVGQNLEIYDSIDSSFKKLYNHSTGHHDTQATDSSSTALHHTLGSSQYQAAAGNHTHSSITGSTLAGKTFYIQSAQPTGPTGTFTVGDVWIQY